MLSLRNKYHAMGNSLGNFKEYWDVINADSSIVGASVGDCVLPISEYNTDYSLPQDNSCRTGVTDAQIGRLRIRAIGEPFCLRAWPYDESALETCRHPHELP